MAEQRDRQPRAVAVLRLRTKFEFGPADSNTTLQTLARPVSPLHEAVGERHPLGNVSAAFEAVLVGEIEMYAAIGPAAAGFLGGLGEASPSYSPKIA
jgi:hypothetical protein